MKISAYANNEPGAEQSRPLRVMMEILSFRRVFHPPKRQTQYPASGSRYCAKPQQSLNRPATSPQRSRNMLRVRCGLVFPLLRLHCRMKSQLIKDNAHDL
jgi:hypothetical protein